jgi:filamentous hemagglutinin family protein
LSRSRRLALLTGVSTVALVAAGALTPAVAGMSASSQLNAANLAARAVSPRPGVAAGPLTNPAAQAQIALSAAHLAQAAQSIRNLTAAQAAASAAAALTLNGIPLSGSSWNGTPLSGLNPVDDTNPTLWVNADPLQKNAATETATVEQTGSNAILTWQSFDLNTGETLVFNQQGNATWNVLNRIVAGPPGAGGARFVATPSQILGSIKADGNVYVINPNGVIFGPDAQVNVHSLIASALDVGDPTMSTAQRDAFFLANGITNPQDVPGHFSFSYNANDTQVEGDVTVDAGAVINANIATSISSDAGGFVYLLAPNVTNAGTINTPAGETMMVAAQAVQLTPNAYLDAGVGQGHFSTNSYTPDPTFRGVGVNFISPELFPGGTNTVNSNPVPAPWRIDGKGEITAPGSITNSGLVNATRGVVILNGDDVTNSGGIAASTSISRNAQVFLDARLNLTLGPGSIIASLPDETGETVPLSTASNFLPASIQMQAHLIDLEPGSLIMAPGATVTATGTEFSSTLDVPGLVNPAIYPQGLQTQIAAVQQTTARIYMAPDSAVDVSGLDDVAVPMSANFLTFKPFGNEFADQPLQRDGALVGQSLTIDIRQSGTFNGTTWFGTPLADVGGLIGDTPVTLDELLTTGGNVKMSFPNPTGSPTAAAPAGEIVTQQGSSINVAGGYLQYASGPNQTSFLITSDGRVVNIAAANPLETYIGVAGVSTLAHPHWGLSTTETFLDPLFAGVTEPGYVEGRDAGTIALSATSSVLNGSYSAGVIDGELQNATGQSLAANLAALQPALADGSLQNLIGANLAAALEHAATPALQAALIANTPTGLEFPNAMPTAGGLSVVNNNPPNTSDLDIGTATASLPVGFQANTALPAGLVANTQLSAPLLTAGNFAQITLQTGGAITLDADADLSVVPGGSINFKAGSADIEGDLTARSGSIKIETTSSFGLPGQAPNPAAPGPYDLVLGSGAVLDASGLWVNDSGATAENLVGGAYVNGGSITLLTDNNSYQGPNVTATQPDVIDLTGNIVLNAGSLLDVSSGGRIRPNGSFQRDAQGRAVGQGGKVTLKTYAVGWSDQTDQIPQFRVPPTTATPDATVVLGGSDGSAAGNAAALDQEINAFGFDQGGTLTLQVPTIQIGGPNAAAPGTLALPDSFFAGNAFGAYSLSSVVGGISVAGTLALQQDNYVASAALANLATGGKPGTITGVALLPEVIRSPVNLTLTATLPGVPFEPYDPTSAQATAPSPQIALSIAPGAVIDADPNATITLGVTGRDANSGAFAVYFTANQIGVAEIAGAIHAPGGAITLNGGDESEFWLDPTALLDVSGTTVINTLQPRFIAGTVLPGGQVNVTGSKLSSTLVASPGAMIDVSGAEGVLDFLASAPTNTPTAPVYLPQTVWSDAGSINLAVQTLLFDGSVEAQPGAPQGNGGSLTASNVAGGGTITVANGSVLPPGLLPTQSLGALAGQFIVEADHLAGSGIASLTLTSGGVSGDTTAASHATFSPGTIDFVDTVSITGLQSLVLDASTVALSTSSPSAVSNVTLGADYFAWRGVGGGLTPTSGTGTLTVEANTIDIAAGGDNSDAIRLNGVATADFISSGDIRFRVPLADVTPNVTQNTVPSGALQSAGDMIFQAAQIYPVSDVNFSLFTPGTISFEANGKAAAPPLSAGGELSVDATNIVQDGTVLAPLGILRLGAQTQADSGFGFVQTQSVSFGAGSVTSVSLNGSLVPFGETSDGQNWSYNSTVGVALAGPPEKDVFVSGQSIVMAPGSTVDLSGGGDIQASEFVPGTGGTHNVLSGANVYAIIPGYNPAAAPVDLDFLITQGEALPGAGSSVFLSGGPGLAAGFYTLLPASYATLPGAYRVTVVPNSQDALASSNGVLADGTIVTAGFRANSVAGTQSARTVDFDVQSAAVWRQYTEIDQTSGSNFFAQSSFIGPNGVPLQLPVDAGHLVFNATNGLDLAGQVVAAAEAGGRGAEVDIASQDIEIVAPGTASSAGYLAVDATQLSDFGADSLLLGGVRGTGANNDVITVVSDSVVVDNNAQAPLQGPQIILATKEVSAFVDHNVVRGLEVDSGSVIAAAGPLAAGDISTYLIGDQANTINGDGALLSVSTGAPLAVVRQNMSGSAPLLNVEAGAILTGPSLTLDSSDSMQLAGATLAAGNISVASRDINFGAAPKSHTGLTVTADILAQFRLAQSLALRTYGVGKQPGTIGFYGSVALSLAGSGSALTLDTSALVAPNGGIVTLGAGTVDFINSGIAPPTAAAGTANLQVNAGEIDFGAGDKVLSGFAAAQYSATQEIGFLGTGSLTSGNAALTFTAPLIAVGSGARQTVTTTGDVGLLPTGANGPLAPIATDVLGGTLTVDGGAITDNTLIEALAGGVTLEATAQDVALESNAEILASGFVQNLFDVTRIASGGTVDLISDHGNLTSAQGATIDVSSASAAVQAEQLAFLAGQPGTVTPAEVTQGNDIALTALGNAGTVGLSAANGMLSSNGGAFDFSVIAGGLAGDSGGRLAIDAQSIGTSALGGVPPIFSNAVAIEIQQGNIDIAAGQNLAAQTVTLTADAGTISVEGTIDASGAGGGSIGLWGGQGVTLDGGSLLATASDATKQGGEVVLGTQIGANNGSGADGIIDLASGTIDVANAAAAANDGTVRLRAPLTATGTDVAIDQVGANIVGASSVTVEAFKVFSTTNGSGFTGTIDPANDPSNFYGVGGTLVSFVENFALSAAAQHKFASLSSSIVYQPGIELDNPNGDITVASNWNLGAGTVAGFLVNATPFTLGSGKTKTTIAAGTVITDANGKLLTKYAGYTGELAFEAGLSQIAQLYYRTDHGSPTGVAPDITMRAAGNVNINADITDGFFQTENRLDPTYVTALGHWLNQFAGGAVTSNDGGYILAGAAYGLNLPGITPPPLAPYDPNANIISPVDGSTANPNDPTPIAGADLFPLIPDPNGTIVGPTGNFDAIASSSYRIVAGANVTSANPLALQPLASFAANKGDVVINEHSAVKSAGGNFNVPTIVRTGMGSIDIAAGQDFILADTLAPGVVYTAGRNAAPLPDPGFVEKPVSPGSSTLIPVAADPSGFLNPLLLDCLTKNGCHPAYGALNAPAFPVDGGNLTVTAQRDIIGNELPASVSATSASAQAARQYFWPWLIAQSSALSDTEDGAFSSLSAFLSTGTVSSPQQTASWINFGTFDQGLMSVGGNVTVVAGRDISRLGVSLPTTARTSGGLSGTVVDGSATVANLPVLNLNPSGDLTVIAGRNLLSGSYYEGSGTATIRVGGSIMSNFGVGVFASNGTAVTEPVSTLLAVDTGTITVSARDSIDLAGVVSATSLQNVADLSANSTLTSMWVSSYGPKSAVSLEAVSGDVTINSLTDATVLVDQKSFNPPTGAHIAGFPGVTDDPASFEAAALLGNMAVASPMQLAASQTGTLALLADGSLQTYAAGPTGGSVTLQSNAIIAGPSVVEQVFDPAAPLAGFGPAFGSTAADLGALLLHQADTSPDLFYAVNGDIISGPAAGGATSVASSASPLQWEVDKSTVVHAGKDIIDLSFFGQNLAPTDVTRILAGRDLFYTGEWQTVLSKVAPSTRSLNGLGENDGGLSLAGPGIFDIEAGRNLGPFVTATADFTAATSTVASKTGTGIISFGNTLVVGNRLLVNDQNPQSSNFNTFADDENFLLPQRGADIIALFGVGKGVDYQAVISQYIDPATATSTINYLPALQLFVQGLNGGGALPSASAAWTQFNALPSDLQDVFVDNVFFNELQVAGSTKQFAEGYQAIDALFQPAVGYTDNCPNNICPSGPPTLPRVSTGNLDLLHATIKTLQSATVPIEQLGGFTGAGAVGGDIEIFGPGGNIDVGSTALEVNKNLKPSQLGILTLDNGVIDTFTDGSVLVDQSRILTVQGGNILMWSSNGNLDAGRGAKSTVDFTPLTVFFDNADVQFLNLNGLVTGAGIGTIQATSDAPAASAELVAPRGEVNAGAAGLRSSGNLVIAAAVVVNAANIAVAGSVSGVPQATSVNLGSLESASNAGGQASNAAESIAGSLNRVNPSAGQQLPAIITVEVLGYGDCDPSANTSCR